jgi:broad specificity phosphatase PhoE
MTQPQRVLLALLVSLCPVAFAGAQRSTVVIVVRHADKDTIPKDDPPLTAAGMVRAKALATALAHADVQAVITTQLVRSQQTGHTVADGNQIAMITVPRGSDIGQHASDVAAEVFRHRGQTLLVVAHGETAGPIIAALGGPRIAEICADEYSNLYTLVLDENDKMARFIQSTYGAPSPPHRSPCESTMR